MPVGYARVSTKDQRLDVQKEALTRSGCDKVFDDTLSGSVSDRPGPTRALDKLRNGDTLVVWKLDRLGRSVKQLVDLVSYFEKEGVHLMSLTDSIDTSTLASRFFFHVMASLAEMERELTGSEHKRGWRRHASMVEQAVASA